jgi:hypothetical protein
VDTHPDHVTRALQYAHLRAARHAHDAHSGWTAALARLTRASADLAEARAERDALAAELAARGIDPMPDPLTPRVE